MILCLADLLGWAVREGSPVPERDMSVDCSEVRVHEQQSSGLHRLQVDDDAHPVELLNRWRQDAREAGLVMPDSAVIATSTRTGTVSARTVCFRRMDRGQFVFLTDSRSKKCRELAENPQGAVAFLWAFMRQDGRRLTRQVRLEGSVKKLPPHAYEDMYWGLIPNRRIRAYICEQGQPADWDDLNRRHDALVAEVDTKKCGLPMPSHFVAYELVPSVMEFYEDTDMEIADRIRFAMEEDGSWTRTRLSA